MIEWFKSFFSHDAEIAFLRNQAAAVIVEYQKAKVKIAEAKQAFEDVRAHTVADFHQVKQSRFEKTAAAAVRIKKAAEQELVDIHAAHDAAAGKVSVKVKSADLLVSQMDTLGTQEYPLD